MFRSMLLGSGELLASGLPSTLVVEVDLCVTHG
jgi:hypothetical protein